MSTNITNTTNTPTPNPVPMFMYNKQEYVWVEKYRPQTVVDLIVPHEVKLKLQGWVKDKQIPNIGLFSSTPGTGKTSVAKALINDLNADFMFINASKENGIDLVRNTINGFASSVSFNSFDDDVASTKVVVLDESDGTSGEFQKSFRAFLEEFSLNCRFILTGNFKEKIMGPILNRLMVLDFDSLFHKHKNELAKQIFSRLCWILENEGVEYNPADLVQLIKNFYPSVREMVNILQLSVTLGEDGVKRLSIDYTHAELNKLYLSLIDAIKTKNFEKCRTLASEISVPNGFYNFIYKHIDTLFVKESIPQVVVLTHHFMTSNANARDNEISLAAFCARMITLMDIKFL